MLGSHADGVNNVEVFVSDLVASVKSGHGFRIPIACDLFPHLINGKNAEEQTSLHLAVRSECANVVTALLERGAKLSARDNEGRTPRDYAKALKSSEIEILLDKHRQLNPEVMPVFGSVLEADDHSQRQSILRIIKDSLFAAVCFGNETNAQKALNEGAYINGRNGGAYTPLHFAAKKGQHGIIPFLIAKGADINARTETSETPLHIAARFGETLVMLTLLHFHGNPYQTDECGKTPLHVAAKFGKTETALALLARGLNPYKKDGNDQTPTDLAIKYGHTETAKAISAYSNIARVHMMLHPHAALSNAPAVGLVLYHLVKADGFELTGIEQLQSAKKVRSYRNDLRNRLSSQSEATAISKIDSPYAKQ